VNLALQSPAGRSGTVAPALAGLGHGPEGGPIDGPTAALGLGGDQPHLLPLAGAFAPPPPWRDRANHRAVGLGNHLGRSRGRQRPIRLLILLRQLLARPGGWFQGGLPYGGGTDLKPVVFLHAAGRVGKSLFATKVGEHPLEPLGTSPAGDSQTFGQGTQVTLRRAAPDPFLHLDQPAGAPPFERLALAEPEGGVQLPQFPSQPLFGARGPLVQRGPAQLADRGDQRAFELVGVPGRPGGGVGELEEALHPGGGLGRLTELAEQVGFLLSQGRGQGRRAFHPDLV